MGYVIIRFSALVCSFAAIIMFSGYIACRAATRLSIKYFNQRCYIRYIVILLYLIFKCTYKLERVTRLLYSLVQFNSKIPLICYKTSRKGKKMKKKQNTATSQHYNVQISLVSLLLFFFLYFSCTIIFLRSPGIILNCVIKRSFYTQFYFVGYILCRVARCTQTVNMVTRTTTCRFTFQTLQHRAQVVKPSFYAKATQSVMLRMLAIRGEVTHR